MFLRVDTHARGKTLTATDDRPREGRISSCDVRVTIVMYRVGVGWDDVGRPGLFH